MTVMDLCLICYRPVYHLCSNDLFDPNNIAVRFCNTPCVVEWKAKNLPEATVAEDTQRVAFDISGWSQDSSAQQASQEAAEPPSSQSSEETLPPESLVAVDSYGIPRDVHHYRQPGKRDNVWDVAHILATPYAVGDDNDAERNTHLHFVCRECCSVCRRHPGLRPMATQGCVWRRSVGVACLQLAS
ncbi:hypothetical protein L915_11803, partial [Phytophthora nicotianae]